MEPASSRRVSKLEKYSFQRSDIARLITKGHLVMARAAATTGGLCFLQLTACNDSPSENLADRLEKAAYTRADLLEKQADALEKQAEAIVAIQASALK